MTALDDRPILLDGCSGQGGASQGYEDAGFRVIGIETDPEPIKRYRWPVIRWDVVDFLRQIANGRHYRMSDGTVLSQATIAAVHVSPPCQAYSVTRSSHGNTEHPMLIAPVRLQLLRFSVPWVIENVEGAREHMIDPLRLCGSEFGLVADDVDGTPLALERHRLFETSWAAVGAGGCRHPEGIQVAGAYGGGPSARTDPANRALRGGYTPRAEIRRQLLRTPWMTREGVGQAIPPVYAEHLGRQMMALVA